MTAGHSSEPASMPVSGGSESARIAVLTAVTRPAPRPPVPTNPDCRWCGDTAVFWNRIGAHCPNCWAEGVVADALHEAGL